MKKLNRFCVFFIIILLACSHRNIVEKGFSARVIRVATSVQLQTALTNAKPGDSIVLEEGIYKGNFVIPENASGNTREPIILSGNRNAILDGDDLTTKYVLHLQANYWIIKGFTITNGLKGLMTDGASYNVIDGIDVHDIGEEAIHFRRFSTHNILRNAEVQNTGLKTPDYGEGVYIGSAVSNWKKYTNGMEDRSDSNTIIGNKIGPNCTAECVDIKEGTTGNLIRGNHFDATGITGANSADSWMDIKGNSTVIDGNIGFNPMGSVLHDGYQVHCVASGWGNDNVFINNNSTVNADGYCILIKLQSGKGEAKGNKVFSNNKAINAKLGITNIGITE